MARAESSSSARQPPLSRDRNQIEERARAIGTKVASLLDARSISASLDTLATAAAQLQNEDPDVAESLSGLAVILRTARSQLPPEAFDDMRDFNNVDPSTSAGPSLLPIYQASQMLPTSSLNRPIAPPFVDRLTGANITIQPEHGDEEDEECLKRRYACEHCGKGFNKPFDLQRHVRSHTGDKPWACDFEGCSKAFVQKSALNVHKRVHTGEKPFKCEYPGCIVAFGDSSALTRHRRRHGINNYSWKCTAPGCSRAFTRKPALMTHMKKMHGSDNETQGAQDAETNDGGDSMDEDLSQE